MSSQEIQAIEQNIKQAKARVEFGAALDRLCTNKDFKLVILEGYLKDEAVRLVHLKASPAMQAPDMQASIAASLDAIGALNQYFLTTDQLAAQAEKSIASDESMLEELAAEELTHG